MIILNGEAITSFLFYFGNFTSCSKGIILTIFEVVIFYIFLVDFITFIYNFV